LNNLKRNKMEKEFVPYELVVKLKEFGFDEPCLCSWNFYTNELNFNGQPSTFSSEDVIQLPLFQQAFRWFREKYGIVGYCYIPNETGYWGHSFENKSKYDTYEEAELACLEKLIEIIEVVKE